MNRQTQPTDVRRMISNPNQKGKRGPDKKPRKRRTDKPQRFLPAPEERIAVTLAAGKRLGRTPGSRNGWTAEEQRICIEKAQIEAQVICRHIEQTGHWPTEACIASQIPEDVKERHRAMLAARGQRLEKQALRKRGGKERRLIRGAEATIWEFMPYFF
ncbi:hypothetical protein AB3X94_06460 [Paraburkholderia sp. BR10923]|uniref:hypothetical protein n=1 Tax=Paraburkholderia sp. BR10923 TaxID=3236992 RepID=UPI0034CEC1AD